MHDQGHHHHLGDIPAIPASSLTGRIMHHSLTFQPRTSSSLLFQSWDLDSAHGLGLAIAMSACLSVMYEGSKFYYHIGKVLHGRKPNRLHGTHVAHYVSRMWKALAYMIHFLIGYILMLCSMTYNLWLLAAVCLGAGIGYFFLLPLIQHVLHRKTDEGARGHTELITNNCRSHRPQTSDCPGPELSQEGGTRSHVDCVDDMIVDIHTEGSRHVSESASDNASKWT